MDDLFRRDQQLVLITQVQQMQRNKAGLKEPTQQKKRTGKIHYEPKELDYEILKYVMEYYFLTVWQLVNLHYSKGSVTRANTKLQILSGNSAKVPSEAYLHRRALHHLSIGNPTYVYSLGTDGINYL